MSFEIVTEFEEKVAKFFGAPYGVAVDSCTHGVELCLRYLNATHVSCPKRTYLSIPMLANKLRLPLLWQEKNNDWKDLYCVSALPAGIIVYDAAVLWKKDSYIPRSFMCISFQYQKHLSLGRGGMILCDVYNSALQLKKMSYDGRLPGIPWRDQNVDTMGYHYYMTPETAQLGIEKLDKAIATEPRQWTVNDWPDISKFKVFQ